jgi:hypothetical protein
VFVDADVLARLPLLSREQRELLAARELARLRNVAEDEVQAMPLPPATALLALVRPCLGYAVVTGPPLTASEERKLAFLFAIGFGRRPISHRVGKVALDWNAWAPELTRLRLQRTRTQLISYKVVDVHGRTWTVRFRHTIAEINQLGRQNVLAGDYMTELDRYVGAGGRRADLHLAVLVAELTIARIPRVRLRGAAGSGSPAMLSPICSTASRTSSRGSGWWGWPSVRCSPGRGPGGRRAALVHRRREGARLGGVTRLRWMRAQASGSSWLAVSSNKFARCWMSWGEGKVNAADPAALRVASPAGRWGGRGLVVGVGR